MICPKCGMVVKSKARECPKCGETLWKKHYGVKKHGARSRERAIKKEAVRWTSRMQ